MGSARALKHRFFCPFLVTSFGHAKEVKKKGKPANTHLQQFHKSSPQQSLCLFSPIGKSNKSKLTQFILHSLLAQFGTLAIWYLTLAI
jgi:hypothetical protein